MLVVIRGNACSGKSTVAEKLRSHFDKVAVIHTEMFSWSIVHGDDPTTVFENTRRIVDYYLSQHYNVIVEGTLSHTVSGKLAVTKITRLAKKYKTPLRVFFFRADFDKLWQREKVRKKLTKAKLRTFYDKTNATHFPGEIIIDANTSIATVVRKVKRVL